MKKLLFSQARLVFQEAAPKKPEEGVVDLGTETPGEGSVPESVQGNTGAKLEDLKAEVVGTKPVETAPAESGGMIVPVPEEAAGGAAEEKPGGKPVETAPAESGGMITEEKAPPKSNKKPTRAARRKEVAKEKKEKSEFPDEIYSFELSQYKEATTEKELEETYQALKKRLETDKDGNITVTVKGTADRVKFKVDSKDKSKVDLHLGDEAWKEWREDFARAITGLSGGGNLEVLLGVDKLDPKDPVKVAFDAFKNDFASKGLESLHSLPIDKQQALMNHAIAYLRAEKLQKVLAEKFGNVGGVSYRIDTEWLEKKGGRISTVVGVEDWEEKPAVIQPVVSDKPGKEAAGPATVPGKPAEQLPVKPEQPAPAGKPAEVFDPGIEEADLVSDVENAVAISKVRAELDRAKLLYPGVPDVQTLVGHYESQLANLKEMALHAGDTVQLEADLETLFQDWLNTFPGVLKAHDEAAKKAAPAVDPKVVDAWNKAFEGFKGPQYGKPEEAPKKEPAGGPESTVEFDEGLLLSDVENMVAGSKVRVELDRARAAYSNVKEVMDLVAHYEMQLVNLKEMALHAGDTVQLEIDLETLFQDWLNTFPGVLKAHDEAAKRAKDTQAAGVAVAAGVEALKGWFGGGGKTTAPAEKPAETAKPAEEPVKAAATTAPTDLLDTALGVSYNNTEPVVQPVVPMEDEGDPIEGMLSQ